MYGYGGRERIDFGDPMKEATKAFLIPLSISLVISAIFCVLFKINADNLTELTDANIICMAEGVNVNEKWQILFNWGYLMFVGICTAYTMGVVASIVGKLEYIIAVMCMHALFSCVNLAFVITMGVWRYNSWGSACAQEGSVIYQQGAFLQNIFITFCVFQCFNCCFNGLANKAKPQ
uniref:Uncharacterized protein n=1 Tax=Strombidinopsis acuminata TaxID=141414 RepID=A0A7S3U1M1_9SPIT|mmetsp:Transcript_8576/g.11251  ORF Transcript_8576/g.11251 Transcript_8576/m.11251 type:complete len:177 (+) Transcript_8576:39-569(+)